MSERERTALPGADLVDEGIADLRAGRESAAALLASIAAPRLRSLGLDIPANGCELPSHRLYELLAAEDRRTAHSRYNALTGRITSFARAAEHARER